MKTNTQNTLGLISMFRFQWMLIATIVFLGFLSNLHADTAVVVDISDGKGKESYGIATGGHDRNALTAQATDRCLRNGGHASHLLKMYANSASLNGPTALAFGWSSRGHYCECWSGRSYADASAKAIAALVKNGCKTYYIAKNFDAKP